MQDWTDLRFFLAVALNGSTMAAGAALKTSQSTVFRRVGALEDELGVTLFERRASGYTLTPAGTALLPLAQRVEAEVEVFMRAAASEGRRQTTVIRFSAPEIALEYMLPPVMAAFRERYPDVRVELIASDRKVDLASGEADVAFRSNPSEDADLFGRRIAYDRPQLTASRDYAARHPLPATDAEVADHDVVSPTSVLAALLAEWFTRTVPAHRILLAPDSMGSALTAARSGLGLAILPQFIADRDPLLVPAPLELPLPTFELWVVSHQRLRGSPEIHAFMDFIVDYVAATVRA